MAGRVIVMRKIQVVKKTVLLLLLFLSTSVLAWEELPQDDPDLKPVGRALETIATDSGEIYFYAVLSSDEEQSYLDVYKGLPWQRIHRWPITFEGEKVKVRDRLVLRINHDRERKLMFFYWNDYVGYAEAAVHQVLKYNRNTGKFSTSWSD